MSNRELSVSEIVSRIFYIRGQKVMIDRDLAELYGIETTDLRVTYHVLSVNLQLHNSNEIHGIRIFFLFLEYRQQDQHDRKPDKNYNRPPADKILNRIIYVLAHNLFIVYQQDHANKHNR
jgi:ORF6N domain